MWRLAVVVACLPLLARADATRIGARSGDTGAWFEAGAAWLHYTPDTIASTSGLYQLTTTHGDRGLSAFGWRLRSLVGVGPWYGGLDFGAGTFGGPTSSSDVLARTETTTTTFPVSGEFWQVRIVVGVHARWSRLMLGAELAPGLQTTMFTSSNFSNGVEPWVQTWETVEARANLGVWLTSRLTIAVDGAVDVMRPDRTQVGVMLGIHMSRYDGTRSLW